MELGEGDQKWSQEDWQELDHKGSFKSCHKQKLTSSQMIVIIGVTWSNEKFWKIINYSVFGAEEAGGMRLEGQLGGDSMIIETEESEEMNYRIYIGKERLIMSDIIKNLSKVVQKRIMDV